MCQDEYHQELEQTHRQKRRSLEGENDEYLGAPIRHQEDVLLMVIPMRSQTFSTLLPVKPRGRRSQRTK